MSIVNTQYVWRDPKSLSLKQLPRYEFFQIPGEETVYRLMQCPLDQDYVVLNMNDLELETMRQDVLVEQVDIDVHVKVGFIYD